ncbi:MAG: 16S rRNA (cytosine(967)-C(5))-methyltransferase RsmB [Lachnospiraceae bacterium]|nr:16S rRNA (cytosine(967)-C(5))-methyltransferase RsmB [Lachnospiraceae bacterium]
MAAENDELLLRRLAMEILLEADKEKEFGNTILKSVLDKYDYLDGKKKAFVKKLAMGCLERRIQLDYVINLYAKTKTAKMKPVIRILLEMGAYQILFMDQVYDSTACNLCVSLAQKKGFSSLSGFVNGILRTICREKEQIPWPDYQKEKMEYLHVFYSQPKWLISLLTEQYGEETAEEMLKGFGCEPETSIRFPESVPKKRRDALMDAWEQAGIEVTRQTLLPYACSVRATDRISNMEGFETGEFVVQDISSMLVCECAGMKAGDVVFDVCASPGGKTLHAADKLQGTGQIYSFDLTPKKVDWIIENAERLGYDTITAKVLDATKYEEAYKETADVLLADVPCSGMGVIARKQDISHNLSEEKLESLVSLQREIVANVSRYVKKGGTLVYSTCTLNKKENDENVAWITEELGFHRVSLKEKIPQEFHPYLNDDGTLQLYRGKLPCDGFFIAVMIKD